MDELNNQDLFGPPGGDDQMPDFAWEQMKDGIFDKIEAEDPDFFKEEKKRRYPFLIWFGGSAFVLTLIAQIWVMEANSAPTILSAFPILESTAIPKLQQDLETPNDLSASPSSSVVTAAVEQVRTNSTKTKRFPQSNVESVNNVENVSLILENTEKRDVFAANIEQSEEAIDPVQTALENTSTDSNLSIEVLSMLSQKSQSLVFDRPISIRSNAVPLPSNKKEEQPTLERKRSLIFSTGALWSSSRLGGSSDAVGYRNDFSSNQFGAGFELAYQTQLRKGVGLIFILGHQRLYQHIEADYTREVETTLEDVVLHIDRQLISGQEEVSIGDTTVTSIERNQLVTTNTQSLWQVGVGFSKRFSYTNWHFRPTVALVGGRRANTQGYTISEDGAIDRFDSSTPLLNRWYWNTRFGLGIDRSLSENLFLTIQYQAEKQWANGSSEREIVWKPLRHGLSLGIGFRW